MLNTELLYYPEIPVLGIWSREIKAYVHTNTTQVFVTALFITAKKWEQSKHPLMDEWTDKMGSHLYKGVLLSDNKVLISANFCSLSA